MELNAIERDVDVLIKKAFDEGGTLWFVNSGLSGKDECYMNKINVLLSQYGEICGMHLDAKWSSFKLNNHGIDIVRAGGIAKEHEREDSDARLKGLNLKVAEMQAEKLEYEKKIRKQEGIIRLHKIIEFISWAITSILAAIHFFPE